MTPPEQRAAITPPEQRAKEQEEAEHRSSPSGKVIYKAILKEGQEELARPAGALFWSGLAAGLSMGFSLITEGLLRTYLPDTSWQPLIAKLGYSVGFLIVILGRQQLFTENTLTPILPLLKEKRLSTAVHVARLWTVVLLANLLGAFCIGYALARLNAFDPEVQANFVKIGTEALEHDFTTTLVRAIFAGWLIALMVWLLPFAESARIWVIVIITYIVGIGHFSHIIAGAVETFVVAAAGEAEWTTVFARFIVPTLIGNVLGGVALVAALNHAQVVAGSNGEEL